MKKHSLYANLIGLNLENSTLPYNHTLVVNTDAVQSTLYLALNSHFHNRRVLIMLYSYYFQKHESIVWVLDNNIGITLNSSN